MNTIGGDGSVVETNKDVKEFLFGSLDIPLANLETSLKNYVRSHMFGFVMSYDLCLLHNHFVNCLLDFRNHQKNPLISVLFQGRLNLNHLQRKKLLLKSQRVSVLHQPPLQPLILMTSYCYQFQSSQLLDSFSRFIYVAYNSLIYIHLGFIFTLSFISYLLL